MAFALFVVAMITDKIDGDIARARNLVTDFGKIADPIADKAITGMAFIGLSIVGDIWWWVHHPGAGPRVERDPAAALDPQGRRDRGLAARQDQDHPPGGRRSPGCACRCRQVDGGARPRSARSCSTSARCCWPGRWR